MSDNQGQGFAFQSRIRPLKRQIEDIFSVSELINVVDSNVNQLGGTCFVVCLIDIGVFNT